MSSRVIWEDFRLNHYIIKSHEEYTYKKSARGSAQGDTALDRIYFVDRDENEEEDIPDAEYVEALNQEIQKLHDSIKITLGENNFILHEMLQTVSLPTELPLIGCIDRIEEHNGMLEIEGWGLVWKQDPIAGLEAQTGVRKLKQMSWAVHNRPDVLRHYPLASSFCGFSTKLKIDFENIGDNELVVRAQTASGELTEPFTLPLAWKQAYKQRLSATRN